jgi:hypothetical protein
MAGALKKLLKILAVYNGIILFILTYNGILIETDNLPYAIFAALFVAIATLSFVPFSSEKAFYSGRKESTKGLSYTAYLLFLITILCFMAPLCTRFIFCFFKTGELSTIYPYCPLV